MRTHIIHLTMVVAALGVGASACGGGSAAFGGSDEAQVRRLFDEQLERFKDKDWRDFYAHLSPAVQRQCGYDEFLDTVGLIDQLGFDLDDIEIDELKVSVAGDMAWATYVTTHKGEDIDAVTEAAPDLYVKIDGVWYDDYDEHTDCA